MISSLLVLLLSSPVWAQDDDRTVLPSVIVSEDFSSGPGVSPRLRTEKEPAASRDVHQVLIKTPGVIVQEEDAFGLRPNISLRGVAPHRSRKITLLEDGLLIGPAPYSAPAAYYTPSLARTRGLDVLRGFRAVPYGPNSVGGAVDYLTLALPRETLNQVRLTTGSFGTLGAQGLVGRSFENGRFLLMLDHLQNEGFKRLPDGEGTGFQKHDFMLKAEWSPPDHRDHLFEIKLSAADEASDETYLGLTNSDYDADPVQRYAASEGDLMRWRHQQIDLGYRWLRDNGEVRARAYHRAFWRDWHRFNGFMDAARDVNEILRNPTGGNEVYADILRGRQDSSVLGGGGGDLDVVNNERRYGSTGFLLERKWAAIVENGEFEANLGLLAHGDSIERMHTRDVSVISNGHRTSSGQPLVELTRDRQEAEARVVRGSVKHRQGAWTVAGSLRHEQVDYAGRNRMTGQTNSSSEYATLPGLGLAFAFLDSTEVFATLSQGVTMRGSDLGSSQEQSNTTELGLRHTGRWPIEVVYFETVYDRLKGVCSFATGCTDNARLDLGQSGGGALIRGLEVSAGASVFTRLGTWSLVGALTEFDARFKESFNSTLAEWGIGTIEANDPLPYVPSSQFNATLSHELEKWTSALTLRWQGEMYDQSVQTDRRVIPAFGVLDARITWRRNRDQEFSVKGDNILNNPYLTSFRPMGARPGKPQSLLLGFSQRF